jgi:hypothetical protein
MELSKTESSRQNYLRQNYRRHNYLGQNLGSHCWNFLSAGFSQQQEHLYLGLPFPGYSVFLCRQKSGLSFLILSFVSSRCLIMVFKSVFFKPAVIWRFPIQDIIYTRQSTIETSGPCFCFSSTLFSLLVITFSLRNTIH